MLWQTVLCCVGGRIKKIRGVIEATLSTLSANYEQNHGLQVIIKRNKLGLSSAKLKLS